MSAISYNVNKTHKNKKHNIETIKNKLEKIKHKETQTFGAKSYKKDGLSVDTSLQDITLPKPLELEDISQMKKPTETFELDQGTYEYLLKRARVASSGAMVVFYFEDEEKEKS